MRTRRLPNDAEGRSRWVRCPFDPALYTVPEGYVEQLRSFPDKEGTREMLEEYGGYFHGFHKLRRFERDGKEWIVLVSSKEWAIELELTDHGMGEIRALSPEEAWRIARERDAQRDPPVELDTTGA